MKKIAFIFPGQGSQYIGMGKDFYETFPCAKEMIDLAEKVSGIPMKELLFEENENINITKYTQIAMLADELAIWSVLREKGFESVVNAGLSLGEYAALVASGVMTPEDAFRVVAKRGEYMQEAVPTGGAMTAVLGADTAVIEKICEETEGIVSIANYNCPGQIVITGEQQAVDAALDAVFHTAIQKQVDLVKIMMMQRDLAQLGIAVAEDLVSGAQHVLALRKILCLARQPAALLPHRIWTVPPLSPSGPLLLV